MTVFYVLGGALAVWALLVTALGLARSRFPGTRGGQRIVMGITSVLVLGAIGSAIVGGALEEEEGAEPAEAAAPAAGEAEAPTAAGQQLDLEADPGGDLAYVPDALDAKAGTVTLAMANPAAIEHNVSLEGGGVAEEGTTVPQGGTSTVTAEVEKGDYTFYCSVPGHQQGGMEGTLSVK